VKRGENQQPFASPEEAREHLAHHGVKGQKWGVRKEEDSEGRMTAPPKPPISGSGKVTSPPNLPKFNLVADTSAKADEYHRLAGDIVNQAGVDPHMVAAKYGPPGMQARIEKQHQADREKLKKVAIGAGIGLGVVAAGVIVYKMNQSGVGAGAGSAIPSDRKKVLELIKTNNKAYGSSVDGLHLNWDKGVDLPQGFVLKRLSSVAETVPRADGFFAAHLDSDVESYKAILPTFWDQWGVGSARKGGFLNHYQAKEAIRAPSGKESFELFKNLVNNDDNFNGHFVNYWDKNGIRGLGDDDLKKHFVRSSMNWADPKNEFTKQWVTEVRKRGYNALIDFNDAGKLGKTPLKIIDGNMFDIVKNEPQSLDHFYEAAKSWSPELIHIYLLQNGEYVLVHIDDSVRVVRLGRDAIGMMPDR
jgi:hypothetical protein